MPELTRVELARQDGISNQNELSSLRSSGASSRILELSKQTAERAASYLKVDDLLRPKQRIVHEDVIKDLLSEEPGGHVRRPTGSGKTYNQAALALSANYHAPSSTFLWDTPVLYLTPRCFLANDVFQKTFCRAFGIAEKYVGVYHSKVSTEERRSALRKPIMITTPHSWMKLIDRRAMKYSDRPMMLLDEVHLLKGDMTRPKIREARSESMVLGWTATDNFMTGETVGDVLFDGKPAIHVTTFAEAVRDKEICAVKNLILKTGLTTGLRLKRDPLSNLDYSAFERTLITNKAGRDEMALDLFFNYVDPKTNIPFQKLSAVFFCNGIPHAETVAEKLNRAAGSNHFARAVSGKTSWSELTECIKDYQSGRIRVLTCADLLIHGLDAPRAQLCIMLRPTRSPIVAEQTAGRTMRLNPDCPDKLAYVVTLIDEDLHDLQIFGQCAGAMELYTPGVEEYRYPAVAQTIDGVSYTFTNDNRNLIDSSDELSAYLAKREEERRMAESQQAEFKRNHFSKPGSSAIKLRVKERVAVELHNALGEEAERLADTEEEIRIQFHDKEIRLPVNYLLKDEKIGAYVLHRQAYPLLRDQLGILDAKKVPFGKPEGWENLFDLNRESSIPDFQGLMDRLSLEFTETRRFPFTVPEHFNICGVDVPADHIGEFRVHGTRKICISVEYFNKISNSLETPENGNKNSFEAALGLEAASLPTVKSHNKDLKKDFRELFSTYCKPLIDRLSEHFEEIDTVAITQRLQLKLIEVLANRVINTYSEQQIRYAIASAAFGNKVNENMPAVKQLFEMSREELSEIVDDAVSSNELGGIIAEIEQVSSEDMNLFIDYYIMNVPEASICSKYELTSHQLQARIIEIAQSYKDRFR